MRFFILILAASCLFFGVSCRKDKQDQPSRYVDIYLNTNDPYYVSLNAVGGWVNITGGVKGILVYRRSNTDFMAYDRYCTYDPDDPNAIVKVDSTNLIVKDDRCGSKFLITDGSVNHPPATLPLRTYQTTFDGTVLHIFN